jgi:hypothetical protein
MNDYVTRIGMKSSRVVLINLLVMLIVTACGGSSTPAPPNSPTPPRTIPIELGTLSVTGTKAPLNPDFDPDVLRYSVIAANSAASEISLTATAASEITITVNGQPLVNGVALDVSSLSQGDVIKIQAQGTGSQVSELVEYEIVYLPLDL